MEVKIKQGKEMIDATIDMVDGVMVVSPKEVKFEPKDGDVVVCDDGGIQIFICKESLGGSIYSYCMYDIEDNDLTFYEDISYTIDRPATEEEKKLLFDKLAEEGYSWDAERKELVKIKWKPSVGQHFYFVEYDNENFIFIVKAYTYAFKHQIESDKTIAKGWCFKTSEECQEFCNRLNDAINQVKP